MTDGRTDGRTDRRTDRRTDGRTDGRRRLQYPHRFFKKRGDKNDTLMLSRLFIAALWSPSGKGLTSWLLFVILNCSINAYK